MTNKTAARFVFVVFQKGERPPEVPAYAGMTKSAVTAVFDGKLGVFAVKIKIEPAQEKTAAYLAKAAAEMVSKRVDN